MAYGERGYCIIGRRYTAYRRREALIRGSKTLEGRSDDRTPRTSRGMIGECQVSLPFLRCADLGFGKEGEAQGRVEALFVVGGR